MQPRGLRNNNPLNIKIGNDWIGEVEKNTDGVFEQFVAVEYGYRAAFIILKKYIKKYGRNTIRKIVDSWSPDGRRLQDAYMQSVSLWCGLDVDAHVQYESKKVMCSIVQGMARVENGVPVDSKLIELGYDMAR